MSVFGKSFLIWSIEHGAWWRPNSMGYTPNKDDAGEYSFEEALVICGSANAFTGQMPNEAMVPADRDEERSAS